MTLAEVKSLLDAGFTKAEIMAFEGAPADADNTPDPAPAAAADNNSDPAPEPAPAAAADNTPDPAPEPVQNPALDQLNANIAKLIRTIQSSNLANNSIDKPGTPDLNTQVDTIMESIIRPVKEVKT